MKSRTVTALALTTVGLAFLYADLFVGLVRAWRTNDDYSHGFLVAPLCAYFVWERRHRLATLDVRPSLTGLAIVMVSLLVLIAGELGAELFLARVSLIGVLAGSVMFVLGPVHARTLAFAAHFALLMIPLRLSST